MPGGDGTGPIGGGLGRGGGGRGRGSGFGQGHDGECRCPNCGHHEPHQLSVPCYNRKCSKCGAPMTRA
ncbi:hypothetical protein B6U98_02195 [Thermoplasmatales archaeon ex4572_165]|nr:MAG: hypothetical protein B6U98_02195 [Thermoplasmatales archaeon ex4572_165]